MPMYFVSDLLNVMSMISLIVLLGICYKDKQKTLWPIQQGSGTNPFVKACTDCCSSNAEFSVEPTKKKTN